MTWANYIDNLNCLVFMKELILPVLLLSLAIVIFLWAGMLVKCIRFIGKGGQAGHDATAVGGGEQAVKLSPVFVCIFFASVFTSLMAVVML